MAQDFGDEMGDMLIRAFGQACRQALMHGGYPHLNDEYQRTLMRKGMPEADATAKAEALASRPHICIPFGSSVDATYFARVLQENGIAAAPMTDAKGNGYIEFAKDEVENAKQCIPQFSEVMTSLKEMQIAKVLEAQPVSEAVYGGLETIYHRPDLPKTRVAEPESRDVAADGHDGPGHDGPSVEVPQPAHDDRANDAYHHTNGLRDKVLAAREQCRDFDDFREILAKEDVGVTESKSGELMFYEARRDENGEILPHGENENGLKDWSVGAKALRDRYGCDATHDWFERNTPKEPSTLDHDAVREAVPPQKDLNLICNAVRADLGERGIETLDRPDGKMGFVVDADYRKQVSDAVEKHFPGHTPEELGIIFEPHRGIGSKAMEVQEPQVTDGSLDMNGATPDINQNIESHDGMDTATNTARMEREQSNTDVAPSTVRESSRPRLKEVEKECRAASKQLSKTNDSPDRDISDKFQQER